MILHCECLLVTHKPQLSQPFSMIKFLTCAGKLFAILTYCFVCFFLYHFTMIQIKKKSTFLNFSNSICFNFDTQRTYNAHTFVNNMQKLRIYVFIYIHCLLIQHPIFFTQNLWI